MSTYVAWDGNEYPWPPQPDWYEAADGRWWPEGHGPGQAAEAVVDRLEPQSIQPAPVPDQVASDPSPPASFEPPARAFSPQRTEWVPRWCFHGFR